MFDFSKYSDLIDNNWKDYVNLSQSFPNQVYNLFKQSVHLPNPLILYPIAISYMFLPSALSRCIPLLVCYGESGSGKSLTGFFASKLHDVQILSSSDTFASIRNTLNNHKYYDDGTEKNFLMVWEDIDPTIFTDKPDIYRLLKYGIDKATDTISIALQNGVNMSFRVFSPKILSTISPLFSDDNFIEIKRRCLILTTKKIKDSDINDLLNIREIDFNGFNDEFINFWHNEETCIKFVSYKRQLTKIKKHGLSPEKWLISVDLLATLLTLEIEFKHDEETLIIDDVFDAIEFINNYWNYHDSVADDISDNLKKLIIEFLTENNIHSDVVIPPKILESKFDYWNSEGLIMVKNKRNQLITTMTNLGYKLTPKGYQKFN